MSEREESQEGCSFCREAGGICKDRSPSGRYCTRGPGHPGGHVACGDTCHVETWPTSAPVTKDRAALRKWVQYAEAAENNPSKHAIDRLFAAALVATLAALGEVGNE